MFNENKTWEASRDDCRDRGGRLARMMNSTEKDTASKVIPSMSKKYWMGLWYSGGHYKWTSGPGIKEPSLRQILSSPSNGNRKSCYVIEKGKEKLNSVSCKESHAYLCQVLGSQGENVRTGEEQSGIMFTAISFGTRERSFTG